MKMTLIDAVTKGVLFKEVLVVRQFLSNRALGTGYMKNVSIPIEYIPDSKGEITLLPEETGYWDEQRFFQEDLGPWDVVCISEPEQFILVPRKATKDVLVLGGKEGVEKGQKAMEKIASLYGKESLKTKCMSISSIVNHLLLKGINTSVGRYWLSEPIYKEDMSQGGFLTTTGLGEETMLKTLYRKDEHISSIFASANVRPMIVVPPDMILNVENDKIVAYE